MMTIERWGAGRLCYGYAMLELPMEFDEHQVCDETTKYQKNLVTGINCPKGALE